MSTSGRFFVFEMRDKELEIKIAYQLTTNHEARVIGDVVEIDVFRGSAIRRNRTKMATLRFSKLEVIEALNADKVFDLVSASEGLLNLPLVPDEFGWQ